jgi:sugar phosphate isomerase/epimerase
MKKCFRLGATSYVFETDLVGNARQLAGIVEDMELVLFETESHGSNFPNADTRAQLNEIAAEHGMTYTVHLPHDANWRDAVWRDQNQRAIECTRALNPFAYVVHLDGRVLTRQVSRASLARWQEDAERALREIIAAVGDPQRVCVENVEAWNPAYFTDLVARLGTARCIDIGHFWLKRRDPLPELVAHLSQTRVIHLHGVAARDHASLAHAPRALLTRVLDYLAQNHYAGVVTLEVFGAADFFSSHARVSRLMDALR